MSLQRCYTATTTQKIVEDAYFDMAVGNKSYWHFHWQLLSPLHAVIMFIHIDISFIHIDISIPAPKLESLVTGFCGYWWGRRSLAALCSISHTANVVQITFMRIKVIAYTLNGSHSIQQTIVVRSVNTLCSMGTGLGIRSNYVCPTSTSKMAKY